MTEEARLQRLKELHEQLPANTRYTEPPAEETDQWIAGVADVDLPGGGTKHGVLMWTRKSHYLEWHRLRFPDSPLPDELK